MTKRTRTVLLLITLLAAAGYWLTSANRSNNGSVPILTGEAVIRDIAVRVRAVGRLDAARSTVVSSEVRGDKGKIIYLIEDGTRVEPDDLLIRLDPTPFEEEVTRLTAAMQEYDALVAAQEQILEWEKNQAEREVNHAAFELKVAELDLLRLEKGDGPLELAKLEGAATKAKQEYEEKSGYIADLEALEKDGYAYPAEIERIRNKIEDSRRLHETAKRQYESYRDYVLPSLSKKARAVVAQAKMDLEQTKKGVGFKIGKAMASLREATQKLKTSRTLLETAETELEHTVIRAPIPGMAVIQEKFHAGQKRKLRVGDVVWQNLPLIYLPGLSQMVVKTQIREIDLHKVTIGKAVAVSVDAYPDLQLSGVVASIGVLAESRTEVTSAEKYFQVDISVTEEDRHLRPGMTARVHIESATAKDVLSVPVHAIFREDGRSYTFVDIQASYEMREVSVGIQSEESAQIVAGLSEGEHVALSRPPAGEIVRHRPLQPE